MEKGNKIEVIPVSDCKLDPSKYYIIEYFITNHITPGDGPKGIRDWLMVKLKGINEPQFAKFFELKKEKVSEGL